VRRRAAEEAATGGLLADEDTGDYVTQDFIYAVGLKAP
jgi:hypothetical protein